MHTNIKVEIIIIQLKGKQPIGASAGNLFSQDCFCLAEMVPA
jgi:hypothetical protein